LVAVYVRRGAGDSLDLMAWTQPGDKVIIQPPVYHPFFRAARVNECNVVENPLLLKNGRYVMDVDHLEQIIDTRTKVFVLCSPHNPVGRVWSPEELKRVGEICLKHNVLLCSDEIHWDLALPGNRHVPTASVSDDIAQNTITLTAPNKTFNLAGVSIAMAIIPNAQLRTTFIRMQQELGIHMAGNVLGTAAAEAAYTYGEEWLDHVLNYIQGNLGFLAGYLQQHLPHIQLVHPEGTYLAWLDFRTLGLENVDLKNALLKEAKVWLNDGPSFGTGGAGFQRLNLACPRSVLQEALERLKRLEC
jgi:cystathionine beta-lyase